ncbi:MAG TPA: hypothetical protein VEJ47_09640 [Candidatus Eremiobacteraceae bacterium]|nr:hypothetical protein [Candidatus Eremiobacteraceae bacterium]
MTQDDLDRILSNEPQILASSGFVDAVMDSVRRQATVPPPIPFPWKRALPGISAVAFTLAVLVIFLIRGSANQSLPPNLVPTLTSLLETWKTFSATWVVLALLLSFASLKLSMRLAGGKT